MGLARVDVHPWFLSNGVTGCGYVLLCVGVSQQLHYCDTTFAGLDTLHSRVLRCSRSDLLPRHVLSYRSLNRFHSRAFWEYIRQSSRRTCSSRMTFRLVAKPGQSADDTLAIDWIAERAGASLLWSSVRCLSSLGWDGSTKDTQPDAGFRTQRKTKWKDLCKAFSLDIDTHFPESSKALRERARQQGNTDIDISDRPSSFSTLGLYVVLADYVHGSMGEHNTKTGD
eukprot:4926944-Amphidinium_carterae.2